MFRKAKETKRFYKLCISGNQNTPAMKQNEVKFTYAMEQKIVENTYAIKHFYIFAKKICGYV